MGSISKAETKVNLDNFCRKHSEQRRSSCLWQIQWLSANTGYLVHRWQTSRLRYRQGCWRTLSGRQWGSLQSWPDRIDSMCSFEQSNACRLQQNIIFRIVTNEVDCVTVYAMPLMRIWWFVSWVWRLSGCWLVSCAWDVLRTEVRLWSKRSLLIISYF